MRIWEEKNPVIDALVVENWTGEPVVDTMVGPSDTCLLDVGVAVMLDLAGAAVGPLTSSLLMEISRVNSFEGVEVSNVLSEGPRVVSLLVGAEDGSSVGLPLVGVIVGLCEGDLVLGGCDGLAVVG